MANEPTLRKTDIEELEDRVTILEGGTPEPHSNTMTKPELEDLEDRITVLEGGTPGTHTNPMRFEFFTSTEERVEELEEQHGDRTVTYDVNGGTGSIDPVTVVSGTEITLNDGSTITPPTNKEFIGWCEATTPTEQKPLLTGKYTVTKNVTLYAIYRVLKVTLTYDYNGATDPTHETSSTSEYSYGTEATLILDPTESGWVIPSSKEFGGWTTVCDDATTLVTSVILTEDTTVYALWIEHQIDLINIEVDEELLGVWLKHYVEIDTSDSYVQSMYEQLETETFLQSAVYSSTCSGEPIPCGSSVIHKNNSNYKLHTEIEGVDLQDKHNIYYTRVLHDTVNNIDGYELSGTIYVDGTLVDLSTISDSVYLDLSYFEDPVTFSDSSSPDESAALVCKFFFKEVDE